jgi:hypothetical protein
MPATFTDLLTDAHRKGDETELNRLLDVQIAVREEIVERIKFANDAAADLAHQLHALGNLIDGAKEQGMSIEDGEAPPLKAIGEATTALQEWIDR